ncbi:hypothetical protein AKH06_17360 [Vibrio parahaemolyticus]|nr:hypothetical protein AKH02_20990 [Vibrio parahaemolyticus]OCP42939.1 hypothetical protein AKH06_17360 [Vibrio parahaemolyticus]
MIRDVTKHSVDQANASLNGLRSEISTVTKAWKRGLNRSKRDLFMLTLIIQSCRTEQQCRKNRLSTKDAQQGVEEWKRKATALRDVVHLFTL